MMVSFSKKVIVNKFFILLERKVASWQLETHDCHFTVSVNVYLHKLSWSILTKVERAETILPLPRNLTVKISYSCRVFTREVYYGYCISTTIPQLLEKMFTQNQLTIVGSKQRKVSIDIFFGKQVLQCRTEAIFGMYKMLTLLKELCNVYWNTLSICS